jgi:tetratricopeptide (TPR) repeat protein
LNNATHVFAGGGIERQPGGWRCAQVDAGEAQFANTSGLPSTSIAGMRRTARALNFRRFQANLVAPSALNAGETLQGLAPARLVTPFQLRVVGSAAALLLSAGCGGGSPAKRAALALEEGRAQDAWVAAGEAIAADSSSAEAWMLRARAALRTFRTKEGVAAADRAVELDSTRAEAHLVRAYLFQRRLRNVAANAAADLAATMAPTDARMHVARGELHLGGGVVGTPDYETAVASFREALRLDRSNRRARLGLARTLVLQANDEEAAALLEEFLTERPYHGEAVYLRGVIRMRNAEMEAAAEDFRRAAVLLADPAPAQFNLARVLERLGKSQEAGAIRADYPNARIRTEEIKSGEMTWHEEPSLGTGLRLSVGFRHAGRFDEGLELAETLALEHPGSAPAFLELAQCALGAERPEVAVRAATRAAELAPLDPRARVVLVTACLAAGDTTEAVARAEAAAAEMTYPEITLALAQARLASGVAEEAIRLARDLGGLMAADARVPGVLGCALLAVGKHQNAVRALTNALALRPHEAEWLEARGRAFAALDQPGPAEDDLRAAVEWDPRRASALDALAALFDARGRAAEAKKARDHGHRIRTGTVKIAAADAKWRARPGDVRLARELADLLSRAGWEAAAARVWLRAEPEVVEP